MLIEIEEIEKIEVESTVTPLPNEKGLQEKKRKLHASIDRIIKYYVSSTSLMPSISNPRSRLERLGTRLVYFTQ